MTIRKIYKKEADQIEVFFPFDFSTKEFFDIRNINQFLGHSGIKNTMIYTHVSNMAVTRIQSPLDSLNLNLKMKKNEKKWNDFGLLHSHVQS